MKTINLFDCVAFGLVGLTAIVVAFVLSFVPYAILAGICIGISYIAYTDYKREVI